MSQFCPEHICSLTYGFKSVASYLSFFALVWWVWASQVCYNVRFRQSDWLHRVFVFLQLLVFCALAAFTNNFDITNGIANDAKEQNQMLQLQLSDYYTQADIAVANYRNGRLPTLNARGISITMAFSRLILFAQYALSTQITYPSFGPVANRRISLVSRSEERRLFESTYQTRLVLRSHRIYRFLRNLLFHSLSHRWKESR